ncbi:hypothetical protein JTE90_025608 [Oedothorax gibbosus]|uniref:Sodium/calcium exchanger membrane region domain-containing protein n=1 Tax=Oedothorax gibbosus TaxID=931172 RepID=A0AAV6V886_9ARAC|nr:hypothetical protein JTE90_025608 [Oedothorax gibbosus]
MKPSSNLKSNQKEFESSLKRRRLLVDDNERHHQVPTGLPTIDEGAKDSVLPVRPKLTKVHLVTPVTEEGNPDEATESPVPKSTSPEGTRKLHLNKNNEISTISKTEGKISDGEKGKVLKTGDTKSKVPIGENGEDSNTEDKIAKAPDDDKDKSPKAKDKDSKEEDNKDIGTKIDENGSSVEVITESKESSKNKEFKEDSKNKDSNGEEAVGNHQAVPGTTARPRKDPNSPNLLHNKLSSKEKLSPRPSMTSIESSNSSEATVVPIEEECTPPAYHEFPPDLFTELQRSHGAVVIHIAVIVYMFYAVAVVCDDYFIASLEECCSRLNLSEDVAGATFMAAGSSAPELFTAILAKNKCKESSKVSFQIFVLCNSHNEIMTALPKKICIGK